MGLFDRIKRAFTGEDAVIKQQEQETSIIIDKYDQGMEKTRKSFSDHLNEFLADFRTIDEDFFDDLEETFISSDVGFEMTLAITDALRDEVRLQNAKNAHDVKQVIIEKMVDIYEKGEDNLATLAKAEGRPTVLLFVGVNGVGKTTTIAKLANYYTKEGKKVIIAAGDTFRAAAADQLSIWADRVGVPIVKHKEGADPAAVVYDAMEAAKARNADLVIVDTAGRLHTKVNLMEELKKMGRVANNHVEGAPHQTLLVLDGTTGQNAVSQAKLFGQAVPVNGIVVTKLDGTAKGGVVISIKEELGVPVRWIGVGEGMDDLRPFNAKEFANALFNKGMIQGDK